MYPSGSILKFTILLIYNLKFLVCYLKKLGLIRCNIIHEAHNKANPIITFQIISFHFLKLDSFIHQEVINIHHITIITNENISITVIIILLRDHISLGKAFSAFTLVVLFEDAPPSISIQSHMKGTTVFNLIPQHHWDESQTHLV